MPHKSPPSRSCAPHELMCRASLALRNIENCLDLISSTNIAAIRNTWRQQFLTETLEEVSRKASAIYANCRTAMADAAEKQP